MTAQHPATPETSSVWPKGRLVEHPTPGKVWVQVPHRNDIGSDWIEADILPAAPETDASEACAQSHDGHPCGVCDPPETDVSALTERLAEYQRAWLWNEATDDTLAGWGYHVGQMLYRLPRDSQTEDMQESVESMVADVATLLADLTATRERLRVVEDERDAALAEAVSWSIKAGRLSVRAESAEAALKAIGALAYEWASKPDDRHYNGDRARALRAVLPGDGR